MGLTDFKKMLPCPKHAQIQREAGGLDNPNPLENHKAIGFLSNTDSDPLKNHKTTEPAFSVGTLKACEQNAI